MSSFRLTTRCVRELRGSQFFSLQQPSIQRVSLSSTSARNVSQTTPRTSSSPQPKSHSRWTPARPSSLRSISTSPGAPAESYVAYGLTQKLFEACSKQGDYEIPQRNQKGVPIPTTESGEHLGVSDSWWYKELGLAPTFSTWSQITFLHMYLLTVRLRALPTRASVHTYAQHLIDHFSHNAEHRMDVLHDMGTRTVRNPYLKDLYIQWRGIIAAYDEGLVKGDAVLGAAVWRNLWKASTTGHDGKDVDWTKVAWVVAYMRRVTAQLAKMDEADIAIALSEGSEEEQRKIFGYSPIDRKSASMKSE